MPNRACGRAVLPKDAPKVTDNIPDETQRQAMVPIDPASGAINPTTPTPSSQVASNQGLLASAWGSVSGAVSNALGSFPSVSSTTSITKTAPKPSTSGLVKDVKDDDEAIINTDEMRAAAVAGGVADRFVVYGDSDNGNSIGVPDPSELSGFTYYNIAFWTSNGGPQDQVRAWANATPEARAAMKKKYNDAGIKLMVSAFGATDTPQSNGYHAYEIANRLAGFVKHYSLDGVDIDYEEFDRFAQGRSQVWICNLTRDLRQQLPSPQYTISHAPVAPWFSTQVYGGNTSYSYIHDQVGDLIDFYNVQFYNQGGIYQNTDSLLYQSGGDYPQSSVFEILKYTNVPAGKLMIGKPARAEDADPNGDGFMRPSDLGKTCKVAIQNGWHAGCMFYEFPYMTSHRLGVVRSNSGL